MKRKDHRLQYNACEIRYLVNSEQYGFINRNTLFVVENLLFSTEKFSASSYDDGNDSDVSEMQTIVTALKML